MLEVLRRRPLLFVLSTIVALLAAVLAGSVVSAMQDDADDQPDFEMHFEADDADDAATAPADGSNPLEGGTDAEGDPLPNGTFELLGGGQRVSLADYRGKPMVLNFFGSWCGPCRAEMPALREVEAELGDQVTFFGLAVRPDDEGSASAFVDEMDVTYDTALDEDSQMFSEMKVLRMPTTFFVSASGTVVYSHPTELSATKLRELIDRYLL
jgi:cytochrome c biogenesis protein CcmG, thiol:disulfide interchange protein DsbE